MPAAPGPDAVYRWGCQRVDQGVPAPVQTPPVELQHTGPGPHSVWPSDAEKWVCTCVTGISICVVLSKCVTVVVYVNDTRVNHSRKCLRCYQISRELIGVVLNQLCLRIKTERESVADFFFTFSEMREDCESGCSQKTSSRSPHWWCINSNRRCKYLGRCFWQPDKALLPDISPVFCFIAWAGMRTGGGWESQTK